MSIIWSIISIFILVMQIAAPNPIFSHFLGTLFKNFAPTKPPAMPPMDTYIHILKSKKPCLTYKNALTRENKKITGIAVENGITHDNDKACNTPTDADDD